MSDQQLAEAIAEAHRRGWRIVFDLAAGGPAGEWYAHHLAFEPGNRTLTVYLAPA